MDFSSSSSSQSRPRVTTHQEKKTKKKLKTYYNRKLNLMKKASELSTLCQTDTFLIGYGPQGDDVFTWPENPTQLHRLIQRYKSTDAKDRMKHLTNLSDIIHDQNVTRKKRKAETDMNHQTPQNDTLLLLSKLLTMEKSLTQFENMLKPKWEKARLDRELELFQGKKQKINQTHLVLSSRYGGGGDPDTTVGYPMYGNATDCGDLSLIVYGSTPQFSSFAPSSGYGGCDPDTTAGYPMYGNATDCGDLSLIVHGSTPQVSSSWDGRNSLISTPNYPGCEQYYNHQTQPLTSLLSFVGQDDESRPTTSTSPIDYDDAIDFSFLFTSEETQSVEEEEAS